MAVLNLVSYLASSLSLSFTRPRLFFAHNLTALLLFFFFNPSVHLFFSFLLFRNTQVIPQTERKRDIGSPGRTQRGFQCLLSLKFAVFAEYDQEGTSLGREGERERQQAYFGRTRTREDGFFFFFYTRFEERPKTWRRRMMDGR